MHTNDLTIKFLEKFDSGYVTYVDLDLYSNFIKSICLCSIKAFSFWQYGPGGMQYIKSYKYTSNIKGRPPKIGLTVIDIIQSFECFQI